MTKSQMHTYTWTSHFMYIRLGRKGVNFGICLSALGVSYVTSNDEAVVK